MQTTNKKINSSYKETVKEALSALNKKNMALILHGVSFPSLLNENTGFGTYNSNGAKELMNFAGGMFNAIQLGPNGKTKPSDSSPYTGTVFSQNPGISRAHNGHYKKRMTFRLRNTLLF